ncbi:aprataxin [Capsaspora owczarzaki ATCC 30864]|nr:aprataxin [Capsaspora owczarzaki ATCC 30864]|eukprot:XP_004343458.2 aprataxin [Capsaspora owczarzaki ATCC 30864]
MFRAAFVEPGGRERLQCRDGATSIGRTEQTGITDLGCSREQIKVRFSAATGQMQVQQCGKHPSVVNRTLLSSRSDQIALDGSAGRVDVELFLPATSTFPHRLIIEPIRASNHAIPASPAIPALPIQVDTKSNAQSSNKPSVESAIVSKPSGRSTRPAAEPLVPEVAAKWARIEQDETDSEDEIEELSATTRSTPRSPAIIAAAATRAPKNAFDALVASPAGQKTAPSSPAHRAAPPFQGNWSNALYDYIRHPDRYKADTFFLDKHTMTIRDKFAKAKHHLLVLPLTEIESVTALEKMKERADFAVSRLQAENRNQVASFRIGFHAVPSMRLLHLHVISQDFDSAHLKNKKHWNSFTTAFFVDYDKVVQQLQNTGQVKFDTNRYESMLKADMKCHVCQAPIRTIPALKQHLQQHPLGPSK